MPRELARSRDQLVPRDAGEMPGQRFICIIERLAAGELALAARDLLHAVVADQHRIAVDRDPVLAAIQATYFTPTIEQLAVRRDRLARDQEPMTRGVDTLSGSFE